MYFFLFFFFFPFLKGKMDVSFAEGFRFFWEKSLQKLELNWKIVLATVIGFLGSGFGTVGGVGGGGIFVPMLNLIVGFDLKSAAALSKCEKSLSLSPVVLNVRCFSF